MANRSIDDLLERLARAANAGSGGGDNARPASPADSGTDAGGSIDASELRNWIARETMYQQMIPPITPEVLEDMDRLVARLPEEILSLQDKPYRKGQVAQMVRAGRIPGAGVGMFAAASEGRSVSGGAASIYEPSLEELAGAAAMGRSADDEDRVVATAVFGGIIAGIAVGRAVAQIMK